MKVFIPHGATIVRAMIGGELLLHCPQLARIVCLGWFRGDIVVERNAVDSRADIDSPCRS